MMKEDKLIGHWPLATDTDDHSGTGHSTRAVDVGLGAAGPDGNAGGAATFNGETSFIEIQDHPSLQLGANDFSLAAWVCDDRESDDVVGDLISKFDPDRRNGMQLSIVSNFGVTSTAHANRRQISFGIDDGRIDPDWMDCGRPGEAVLISALHVSNNVLYAGTLETGDGQMGQLWRYGGGTKWIGLGNPSGCNVIHSVTEFAGQLYCGTGRYVCAGSMLGETLNMTPGGKIYRVDQDGKWTFCGHPGSEDAVLEETESSPYNSGKADDVISLAVYHGNLYCVSNHRRGVFQYEGEENWKHVGVDGRVMTLAVYHGHLYALINGGPVYRYEGGSDWTFCGNPEGSRQTYSAAIHQGRLYVGTWPNGEMFMYEGKENWTKLGRVFYSREIMGMANYNGKVFLGTLPMANVCRMDSNGFCFVGNLDASPVVLRRVWSMAVYEGRLFAGTLPSGHVLSLGAGSVATWDRCFPGGWHHIAAVREGEQLKLYVDGALEKISAAFAGAQYNLNNKEPLRIGFGAFDYFRGSMSDVRLYGRALGPCEIRELAG